MTAFRGLTQKTSSDILPYGKKCVPLQRESGLSAKGVCRHEGEYQSGQMGQTVNLLVYTFGGSNPSSPT